VAIDLFSICEVLQRDKGPWVGANGRAAATEVAADGNASLYITMSGYWVR